MLIGRGEMESVIRRKVNRRGLQDAVLFLGNRRKIERYYQAMDAFVLPSRYEGAACGGRGGTGVRAAIDRSTDISRETKLLESTQFISLSEPPEMGTKVLETAERTTRCNTERQMTEKGFNIAVEAKKLEVFYQKAFWDNRRNRYGTAHQRHRSHL